MIARLSRPLAVTVVLALAAGCGANLHPHVKLDEAPTAAAPYAARADYYKRHNPDAYDGVRMVLHDGTAIYWPEDLRPAVAPTSPTAKAIDRVEDARAKLKPMEDALAVTGLVSVAGLGAMGASMLPGLAWTMDSTNNDLMGLAALGLLVGGGAAITGAAMVATVLPVFYMEDQQRFSDAIGAVVTTYPQSLSDRVAIQPDANGRLVDLTVDAPPADPAKTAGTQEL